MISSFLYQNVATVKRPQESIWQMKPPICRTTLNHLRGSGRTLQFAVISSLKTPPKLLLISWCSQDVRTHPKLKNNTYPPVLSSVIIPTGWEFSGEHSLPSTSYHWAPFVMPSGKVSPSSPGQLGLPVLMMGWCDAYAFAKYLKTSSSADLL